jgi:ubiquinone/menaquinone biosynthesis C-methylase UbiE
MQNCNLNLFKFKNNFIVIKNLSNTTKNHRMKTEYIKKMVNFNEIQRDRWINEKSRCIATGSIILDIGAGTCPYKDLFRHCSYFALDFVKYKGIKRNGRSHYGKINVISDILHIPVKNDSVDVVLCTEVLEHVFDPISAIKEMARVLKTNGTILLTAPLGSGLHQLPYHFYGGFTPEWYKRCFDLNKLCAKSITPNGGFFKHLAQETARAGQYLEGDSNNFISKNLLNFIKTELPQLYYLKEKDMFIPEFTVGYFVEGYKI